VGDGVAIAALAQEAIGFQSLRTRSFKNGNRCSRKIELFRGYETSESEIQKVSALRLFHPTVSSLIFGTVFVIVTQSPVGVGPGQVTVGGRTTHLPQRVTQPFGHFYGQMTNPFGQRNRK